MISVNEILMGREVKEPLSPKQWRNLADLLARVNMLRAAYGKSMFVSSGYRPPSINAMVGGSKRSAHLNCQAVDFRDKTGELAAWCLMNMPLLEKLGLYMEDPRWTTIMDGDRIVGGWTHLQTRPTRKNPFVPNNSKPLCPDFYSRFNLKKPK